MFTPVFLMETSRKILFRDKFGDENHIENQELVHVVDKAFRLFWLIKHLIYSMTYALFTEMLHKERKTCDNFFFFSRWLKSCSHFN